MNDEMILAEAEAHIAQALCLLDSVGELDAAPYLDTALVRLRSRNLDRINGVAHNTAR